MLRQEGLGKYQCLASKWGTVGQDDAKRDSHSHSQSITVYQLKRYHTLLDLDRNFDESERCCGKRTGMLRGGGRVSNQGTLYQSLLHSVRADGGWGVWNATKTSISLSEIQSSGVLGRIRKKCLKQISFWDMSDTCQIDEGSL